MHCLSFHLDRLYACLARGRPDLHWQGVALADEARTDRDATRLRVPRAALASPEQFAPRFDEYLHRGYSWINLSAAGVVNGTLVVIVELPTQSRGAPPSAISVNLSGPERIQLELVGDDLV
jgi:hypothetical protein